MSHAPTESNRYRYARLDLGSLGLVIAADALHVGRQLSQPCVERVFVFFVFVLDVGVDLERASKINIIDSRHRAGSVCDPEAMRIREFLELTPPRTSQD